MKHIFTLDTPWIEINGVSVAFHARVLAGVYSAGKFVIVLRQYIVFKHALIACTLKCPR